MKLADHLEHWLIHFGRASRSPNTVRAYTNAITKLKGLFGPKIELADLTRPRIEMTLRKLETNHAPRTIRLLHHVLTTALEVAVERGHLTGNPARGARMPKPPRPNEFRRLDAADVSLVTLHSYLVPVWGAAVRLALTTGLRRAEICSLRWRDWDFAQKGFMVQQSKTSSGRRWITVPGKILTEFQTLSRGQHPDSYVFKSASGGRVPPDYMGKRIRELIERAGVKGHWTTHSLRHTHASILVENGRSLPDVARRLGHSSPRVTMDIYAHPAAKGDALCAADMETIL